jgi:hypothetical protein
MTPFGVDSMETPSPFATVGRSRTEEYTRRPGVDMRLISLITGSPSKDFS